MKRAQMLGLLIFIMSNGWINAHPRSAIVDSGDILLITVIFTIQMIGLAIIFLSADD